VKLSDNRPQRAELVRQPFQIGAGVTFIWSVGPMHSVSVL